MYNFGETAGRQVSMRSADPVADETALALAYPSSRLVDGMTIALKNGHSYQWIAASTAADATSQLVVLAQDAPASGRWLRRDAQVDIKVPVDFNAADAAVLLTVPVGFRFQVVRPWWEVVTPFTGGTSSAIGLSSSNAAYATKGDLLGGAAGDLAAALTAGFRGAVGAKVASLGLVVLVAGDTVRFDRIASQFTAGAGFAHVTVEQVAL